MNSRSVLWSSWTQAQRQSATVFPLASQKVNTFWVHAGQDTGMDGDLWGGRLYRNKAEWVCTELC